jgi:hypothetical protein
MQCCTENPYQSGLCRSCWQNRRSTEYHCTWPNCLRPVLTLTLCRSHYRQINVECAWPQCHRPSYCRQVCAHHYRKREFPEKIQCHECSRPMYMDGKCFYHFTCRTCVECTKPVFSKQLCQRHYMKQYRRQRLVEDNGPTTSKDASAENTSAVPVTTNHMPVNQSSFEHTVIV